MTISNENYRNVYTLNESTTSFPYTFNISADSDLRARLYNTSSGAFTTLTLNSDYTVSGAGDEGGGTVTYPGAASYGSTYKLVLDRDVPYTQTTDLINNDESASFNETLEDTFDRLVILIQQLLGETERSLKFDSSVTAIDDIAAITAGYLYWNGTSVDIDDAVETDVGDYNGTISAGTDAAKPASPSRNDLYFAYDTNKFYKCLTNGSWSNVWVLGDTTADSLTATSFTVGDIDSTGAMTISGPVDIGTSLKVATGATITSILDEDLMTSNSATALATQQSIKAYVDSVAPSDARIKAWAAVKSDGTLLDSFNISSVVKGGTGIYTVNWDTDFASANYAIAAMGYDDGIIVSANSAPVAGSVQISVRLHDGTVSDKAFGIIAIGDQA